MGRTITAASAAADTCTYDAEDRVTNESEAVPGLTPIVTLSDVYAAGNRTQLAATIGGTNDFVNNYQYAFDPTDNLYGQMSQVTQSAQGRQAVAAKRVDFTYFADGQFSTIARYASLDTSQLVAGSAYAYSAAGQITSLTHTAADGTTTYAAYTWTYNASGEVSSFTNNVNAADYSAENVGTYTYDATAQLTGAKPPIGTSPNAANSPSNAYDANGNATSLNGVAATVVAGNTLANDGTWAYFYDAGGNLIKKVGDAGGAASGWEYDYAYDNRNRLTTVTELQNAQATAVINYTYDAFDRLVGRTVTGSAAWTQRYVYDGGNIVLAFDGSGNLTDRYLWGPGINQLLADENFDGVTTLWALCDNQNTVRDLVTDNGTLAEHIAYSPFGQQLVLNNGAYVPEVVYAFGYTGSYTDVVTADQLHGVRWYDPATQRWLTQDPDGLGPDANPYRYCGNGPTDWVDPSGLRPPAWDTPAGPPYQGNKNEYYPEVAGLVKTGGCSPETLEAASSIIESTEMPREAAIALEPRCWSRNGSRGRRVEAALGFDRRRSSKQRGGLGRQRQGSRNDEQPAHGAMVPPVRAGEVLEHRTAISVVLVRVALQIR